MSPICYLFTSSLPGARGAAGRDARGARRRAAGRGAAAGAARGARHTAAGGGQRGGPRSKEGDMIVYKIVIGI